MLQYWQYKKLGECLEMRLTTLVSPCSSTDSELKLWNVESEQCVRTYKGHVNEKHFVGLTVNRNFIACGKQRGIPSLVPRPSCSVEGGSGDETRASPDISGGR